MAFGPEPLGLAYFAGVKLAGYTAIGLYVRKKLNATKPHGLTFGAARTVLGLIVGIAFASSLAFLDVPRTEAVFYVALAPVRFAEWLATFWFFFGRGGQLPRSALVKYSIIGSVWSYLLDVPAMMSIFLLPGGAWIC